MRVYLGSDHAGFELKGELIGWLTEQGHEPIDCGAFGYDDADDYPPYVIAAAELAVNDAGSVAVVIGGSGNGEQIAANKVTGARAALCWSEEIASLARQHNHANVCGLGARFHDAATAKAIVKAFIGTPVSEEPRHVRRIAQIAAYESFGSVPPAGE